MEDLPLVSPKAVEVLQDFLDQQGANRDVSLGQEPPAPCWNQNQDQDHVLSESDLISEMICQIKTQFKKVPQKMCSSYFSGICTQNTSKLKLKMFPSIYKSVDIFQCFRWLGPGSGP